MKLIHHIDTIKFARSWDSLAGAGSGVFKTTFYKLTFCEQPHLQARFEGVIAIAERNTIISNEFQQEFAAWRRRMKNDVNARNRFHRMYNMVCTLLPLSS